MNPDDYVYCLEAPNCPNRPVWVSHAWGRPRLQCEQHIVDERSEGHPYGRACDEGCEASAA